MNLGLKERDQRGALRVSVSCKVKIRPMDLGLPFYGDCTDLSVTGMTVQTSYVPRPDEEFDIYVMPARAGNMRREPFSARVKVRRSHRLDSSSLYELGLEIIQVNG
ncbi:PilZ domain-containing protein [Chitinibacter bivalviorum]|uniref:PilZ domain-containing protein n=1 Tax=Chitinibacter bivalviorum TaxID=2739434 RepID=A0A7H9BIP6_9NEIS|nr:PilZ domain-containing protein [Chitinibacter bivalviorum]QLG88166.1 PilZ domain-containing protein [Chitinibacter bivalviorum]